MMVVSDDILAELLAAKSSASLPLTSTSLSIALLVEAALGETFLLCSRIAWKISARSSLVVDLATRPSMPLRSSLSRFHSVQSLRNCFQIGASSGDGGFVS